MGAVIETNECQRAAPQNRSIEAVSPGRDDWRRTARPIRIEQRRANSARVNELRWAVRAIDLRYTIARVFRRAIQPTNLT